MKCATHKAEAIGVCAYCGRAICSECVPVPQGTRMSCSEACAHSMSRGEQAIDLILSRSLRSVKAVAQLLYFFGGCFIVVAVWTVVGLHESDMVGLILFGGGGVIFIAAGVWYRKKTLQKQDFAYHSARANAASPRRSA
jgi:hypothetical protein